MKPQEFEAALLATLADRDLSRGETRALRDRLRDANLSPAAVRGLRARMFDAANAELVDPGSKELLRWTEEWVKLLDNIHPDEPQSRIAEVWFTPEMDAVKRLLRCIDEARRTIDVCVYTITDNRLTRALERAHRRRVDIRVVTETDKASDLGSDVDRLREAGIPLRSDNRDEALMHHKYAIFDQTLLATGSYNWTRGAANENYENIVVTDDNRLVVPFRESFESLWNTLG